MKILTAAEMAECDRRTVEDFGIPLTTLMENAGAAVSRFVIKHFAEAKTILVLAGKGNNGGDGAVAARHLAAAGKAVRFHQLGDPTGAASDAFKALTGTSVTVTTGEIDYEADLIIDAVFGTGFKPPLREPAASIRAKLQNLKAKVVAIDLPSGWDADSTAMDAEAFRADAVVTFTAPKMAHVFGNMGVTVVADIGSPDEAIQTKSGLYWTGSSKSIAEAPRASNSNKGTYGHVLVIGGSRGKAGAPAMASMAALRTGAGLVTAGVVDSIVDTVASFAPELMLQPLKETADGSIDPSILEKQTIERIFKGIKVLAIGPGCGTLETTPQVLRTIVLTTKVPVVVDADAINAFESRTYEISGEGRTIVLTPHPAEMARLTGQTTAEVESNRISVARDFAVKHKVTVLLKGWRTLVAHPDGNIGVNTTGSPGMAKGGSGDVLTGMVAAMISQYPEEVAKSVDTAGFLHGYCGQLAGYYGDEHTVLATDLVGHLSEAFRYRVKDEDGFTWITGLRR